MCWLPCGVVEIYSPKKGNKGLQRWAFLLVKNAGCFLWVSMIILCMQVICTRNSDGSSARCRKKLSHQVWWESSLRASRRSKRVTAFRNSIRIRVPHMCGSCLQCLIQHYAPLIAARSWKNLPCVQLLQATVIPLTNSISCATTRCYWGRNVAHQQLHTPKLSKRAV